MLISLNWLREFIDIPSDFSPEELANRLTLKTAEIETVIKQGKHLDDIVIGKIQKLSPHPDADSLTIATTDIGDQSLQIVCGGANLKENMLVAVAKIGATVSWHGTETITMKKTKIRGVESHGMICAGEEIDIDDPNAGPKDILDLTYLKSAPGTPLATALSLNDIIFEFDNKSLTHRPDLWGHYGIAREISALTKFPLKVFRPTTQIPETGKSPQVTVETPELCPRYSAIIVENIVVEESPAWLKSRLKSVDHGTHNNIVDITNYVMAETGQPLHAFDLDNIKEGIVVRSAKPKEKITTLKDEEKTLSTDNLVIADHEKPLAIAGIIGGKHSGVTTKTTSILIESANFKAAPVRNTSSKLGIRTDSLQRFEKSLDPHLTTIALKRALEMILKVCPQAKISGPITDINNFDYKPVIIKLNTEKARTKIGVNISNKRISEILASLHFEITEEKEDSFTVKVPSFRSTKDVLIEEDLIEEIARIHGYEEIDEKIPRLPLHLPAKTPLRDATIEARKTLSYGLGFNEVLNYSYYGITDIKNCLLSESDHLTIKNSLSQEQTHMIISHLPNLLKNVQTNIKNFPDLKLYEIARTFRPTDDFFPVEDTYLSGIITSPKNQSPFYDSKGVIEHLAHSLDIKLPRPVPQITATPYAHPKQAITYLSPSGATLAKCYHLHPLVLRNFDLENFQVSGFEINLSELISLKKVSKTFKQIPKFPASSIDISVIFSLDVEVQSAIDVIKKSNQALIESVALFDNYQGPGIPDNKKALAFKINLRAAERTLTDEEVSSAQKNIFNNLETLGGTIRNK
ncbi:phenylalanine--tRNA ligase subunit beta [Candidatus Peregrinibacteria bacterium HGW-Peregrinibacteria-1]|jgi:phenylalanyl-tRNA synthetase beta chain|nr:MAG: phenylalanine--tRNA ligase subunit beta [Candidatus Peregrinibacteria bacterium HGW-Peregrinibacteria-1]